jgi:hypothetical protein
VATVLEAIAQIAPPTPVLSLPEQQAACALSAAITSVFLDRGWLTRGPGRGLRVDADFDGNIEKWLAI